MDLPGALLLWAKEQHVAETAPLFFSRKRGAAGERRAITRQQAWEIVREASARAKSVSLPCALRGTANQVSRRSYIHICFVMRVSVRSYAQQRACRSPRRKQVGVGCKWRISP